jgi:hypothetical protein
MTILRAPLIAILRRLGFNFGLGNFQVGQRASCQVLNTF